MVLMSLKMSRRRQPLGKVVPGNTPGPRQSKGLLWLLQNIIWAYLAHLELQYCMPTTLFPSNFLAGVKKKIYALLGSRKKLLIHTGTCRITFFIAALPFYTCFLFKERVSRIFFRNWIWRRINMTERMPDGFSSK